MQSNDRISFSSAVDILFGNSWKRGIKADEAIMHQAAQLYIFERLALLPQVVQLLGDILLDVSVPAGRDFYNFCMIWNNFYKVVNVNWCILIMFPYSAEHFMLVNSYIFYIWSLSCILYFRYWSLVSVSSATLDRNWSLYNMWQSLHQLYPILFLNLLMYLSIGNWFIDILIS